MLAEKEIQPTAEALRPGIKYTIEIPKTSTVEERQYRQGGCNIHIPITFDDGVEWLARVHYSANIVPSGASSRIRTSELAVMQTARSLAPGIVPLIHIAGTQNGELLEHGSADQSQHMTCPSSLSSSSKASRSMTGPGPPYLA